MKIVRSLLMIPAVLAAVSAAALAASTLVLAPQGDGGFALQGVGVAQVAAFEMTVTYDAARLGNPRVVRGPLVAGAMMAVNPNIPGVVRIAIITTKPVSGNGVIATLAFDRIGSGPGITGLKATTTDINGRPLAVATQFTNPAGTIAEQPDSSPDQSPGSSGRPSAGETIAVSAGTPPPAVQPMIGMILPPSGGKTPASEEKAAPAEASTPANATEPVAAQPADQAAKNENEAAAAAQPKTAEPLTYARESVLDRFREYAGARTPKTLTALFEQKEAGFSQEPSVVVSDGKSLAKINFVAMPFGKKSLQATVKGGTLVSLVADKDKTNSWIALVRPDKGAYAATLVVPQKKLIMQFPVTVLPKANMLGGKSGRIAEKDFAAFLKDRGTPQHPTFDLNNDGKRDYIDEYLFTASYIVSLDKQTASKKKKKNLRR